MAPSQPMFPTPIFCIGSSYLDDTLLALLATQALGVTTCAGCLLLNLDHYHIALNAVDCATVLNASHCSCAFESLYRIYALLRMMSAAITPGIQPKQVSKNTIRIEPQPWSITARGGNKIAKSTLISDIVSQYLVCCFYVFLITTPSRSSG